jgi:hypothetical protein
MKMTDSIIIHSSSNMFHLAQPDSYGWSEERHSFEDNENYCYQQSLNEKVNGIKRRDLPKGHLRHLPEGTYEMDWNKFLNNCLNRAWFETFSELLESRCQKGEVKAALTGVDSPKYYNYATDATLFDLVFSRETLESIRKTVFEHKETFDEYLAKYNASYPGYISLMPDSIEEWEKDFHAESPEEWTKGVHYGDWENAVFSLLGFWLLAYDDVTEDAVKKTDTPSLESIKWGRRFFGEAFHGRMNEYHEDGTYSQCLEFVPEQAEECVPA